MAGHEIGAVLESECPYWQDGERFDAILPPDLRQRAANHRVASVARVFSVEEVIQSLGQRRAATVFGMAWYSGHANYQGGILRGNPGGFRMGGHAVCFVGYREKGEVLETMWDLGGQNHPMITSMREHRGHLYLGGIMNNRIGRLPLEGADPDFVQYERRWGRQP